MSFKCRSSTSLSSHTYIQPWSDSTADLFAEASGNTLGTRTPKAISAPSLLHPRPSLSSIRTYAAMSLPPTLSSPPPPPLPPLPAYIPPRCRAPTSIGKATYPPKQQYGLNSHTSQATLQVAPPPGLTNVNLGIFKKANVSHESLTSIYSRSISGAKPSPRPNCSRTSSATSTSTLKRSPLGATRLASHAEAISADRALETCSESDCETSKDDIDDVKTLEARIHGRAGLVKTSQREGYVDRRSGINRLSYKPSSRRTTRIGNCF